MGIQEYRATGGNKALLKEYHRKSDSLAQWQINFSQYDAQTYVFDHIDSCNPVVVYMPRYYPYGFIYPGASNRTIAHELGHGVAGLEHVFENSNNSGKTANLMDYANGEELWHFQWDQIQDPSRVWMKWNKAESEGESIITGSFSKVFSEKYYRYLNEMLQSPIFKSIYNYLDKSEYYVQIVEKDKDKLSKEELEHYKYFLGYFDRNQTDQTVLFYTVYAGEENRPYKLFLFNSSKKPLSQTAFTDGAPLLEEMFHAAHFFFLKKANKLDNSIFLSQTETEVEFIKAYCLYLMRKQKEKYSNTYSKFFDYYHFWLDQNGNEDEIITIFFDILSNAPSHLTKQEKLFFVA